MSNKSFNLCVYEDPTNNARQLQGNSTATGRFIDNFINIQGKDMNDEFALITSQSEMLRASIENGTINPDETDTQRKRNVNIKKKVSRTFKKMLTQKMARTQFSES